MGSASSVVPTPIQRAMGEDGVPSILYPPTEQKPTDQIAQSVFADLALDRVIERFGELEPGVRAACLTPLPDISAVQYRHSVFRVLENAEVRTAVDSFVEALRESSVRSMHSATATQRPHERDLWHLDAVVSYLDAVETFAETMSPRAELFSFPSDAWSEFVKRMRAYRWSERFLALRDRAARLRARMAGIRYTLTVRSQRVRVAGVVGSRSLVTDVEHAFARFRAPSQVVLDPGVESPALDSVHTAVLERVARLHPEEFEALEAFGRDTADFRDPELVKFVAEIPFYLGWLDYYEPLRRAGLPVCYPDVSADSKELDVANTWDLALAHRLVGKGSAVVTNDLTLSGPERVIVISGPNQGGKSTTARTFGQLHHLAAIGCPVPGESARLLLIDRVDSMFEREESEAATESRLEAEVVRAHQVVESATSRSAIVLNEVFASTALEDARVLTRELLDRLCAKGSLVVCVTFIDELSRLNDATVSMVSIPDADDPAARTFVVKRTEADGRAYARALAYKHRLTAEQIRSRLERRFRT